jgi:hypothetical protein
MALVATTWGLAVAAHWIGSTTAAVAAFAAIALVPGALLNRQSTGDRLIRAAELPARALTLSVGITTISGGIAVLAGLPIVFVPGCLLGVSILLALAPSTRNHIAADSPPNAPDRNHRFVLAMLALLVVATAAVAASQANIARDRMWYLAYVTQLAGPGPLDWSEPFFGTGKVLPRFAYNGWLLTLASWESVCGVNVQYLFERIAPTLLIPITGSAALVLGRTLFSDRRAAALAALATIFTLIVTRYPYFSPEHYPFFTRLVEDKTVALLILLPVSLSMTVSLARTKAAGKPLWSFATWATLSTFTALTATAFTHALVYALLLIGLLCFGVFEFLRGSERWTVRAPVLAAVLVTAIAIGPAWLGFSARSTIVGSAAPHLALETDPEHPVVRSHLRMDRLLPIPVGGPIVDPKLLFEPFLILSLLGGFALLRRRPGQDNALLAAFTFPFLALAFVPWIAPAFGRTVVPWMAYRALWAIPFGPLFIALVSMTGATRNPRATSVLAASLAAIAVVSLPWLRLVGPQSPGLDTETRQVLSEISRLATTTKVAAAPGFSELIPALSGRHVLAFSDRGTTVFAGSKRSAQRRMQAATAIIGLAPGSPRLRQRLVGYYGITHTVYEKRACPPASVAILENDRFSLCAVRDGSSKRPALRRVTAVAASKADGSPLARLGDGIVCRPIPLPAQHANSPSRFRWRRNARWSARPVAVNCAARWPRAIRASRLRLELNLPKSDEALLYRIAVTSQDGKRLRKQGVVEFHGNPNAEIALPAVEMTKIRFRILPAYLPYLNLRGLALLR